jgi:hypothetical protein
MNYNKWSMICTVQYMDLTPPVNIDELHQVEYDMYGTIHGSYSTCKQWWNYIKWSMIWTAQYMDLTPPVNIDELQQVEYDMYRTIQGSYSTCKQWWITSNGIWYVMYNTWILLHLLTLMNYNKWSMICTVQYMYLTLPVNIDELQQVE